MKKKKIYILWILVLFTFIFYWVNALSVGQKWAILENFKEKQYDLLFENDFWIINSEDVEIFDISKKINLFWEIKEWITEDKKNIKQKNVNIISNITSLEESINNIDRDIKNSTWLVKKINTKIINIKKEISVNKEIIKLLKVKIYENKEILLKYLIYIYKKWNNVYRDWNIDNIKSILLNSENISEIINDLYFKWLIQITWKKLIDKHRDFIWELYEKKLEFEKQDIELRVLRKNKVIENKVLNDKKKFKKRILAISKWKQVLYEKYISDKIKIEKNLQLKIFKEKLKFKNVKNKLLENYNCKFISWTNGKLELESSNEQCSNLNKVIYWESKLKNWWKNLGNSFSWPVFPYMGISAYFRDKLYKENYWSNHDAIDIIANQWTVIKAPADWYIVHIQPADSFDYAYVAIKHSDGYLTIYWHVSEIIVNEYDFVKKWQVFAKTWWKVGTVWVGVFTTWPHLHFEVFKDWNYIDPLDTLNLSYLKFNNLAEKYVYKYYKDFKERLWYEYLEKWDRKKVFKLSWLTEVERQKSLINNYAIWQFNNYKMWINESLDWNIDPTFVMCIWLAESWLWKYLKTPYNVWNVWNTDSWSTYEFWSAREWIYSIVSTLNNKYLWKYNEIRKLSRYWNKKWEIYASSPDHWHNNIIKCMSNIKWVYVPDNYNFRL